MNMIYKYIRLLIVITILFLFTQQSIQAKELCDCFGSCITTNPRDVSTQLKKQIKIRDGYSLEAKVEIDHTIPLCLGGNNTANNLQALTEQEHDIKTQNDMLLLYYVENCLMTIEEAQQEALKWKKNKY